MYNKKLLISVLFLTLAAAGNLFAGGSEFNTITDAKTLSLNGMYFAGESGMNSILGNPAGLILLNNKYLEFSVADKVGQQKYEGGSQGLHKSYEEDIVTFSGGLAWSFSPGVILGLSYRNGINYNVNWPFVALQRTDTTSAISAFDLYNKIKVNAASLSGAFTFDNLFIGVTFSAYQVKQETAFPLENARWYDSLSTGEASYQFKYNEDGWTFGFGLGLMYQLSPDLRVGIMTRSGYSADLSGSATSNMFADLDSTASVVDLSSKIEMPWVFGGGLIYQLGSGLTLNADVLYSLWSGTQKSIKYKFNNPVWQSHTSGIDPLTGIKPDEFILNYKNTIDAGIGLEYILKDVILRCGYRFSQSPNSDETYSYLFPSVNQNWLSIGLGYTDGNLKADLGLAYAFGLKRMIDSSNSGFNGNYNSDSVLPTITIKYTL
jgi:long-subunit fatty acid transport protein